MPVTYKKIASVTVGAGGASQMEFTSIPGTYTDLVLHVSAQRTGGLNWLQMTMNGVTSGYSGRTLRGNGSTVDSFTQFSAAVWWIGYINDTASTFSSHHIYIPNYTSSTAKSLSAESVEEANQTTAYQVIYAGLCSSTSAVTSLKLEGAGTNFLQYSTATLYGISKS